jgi:hypothetical protein
MRRIVAIGALCLISGRAWAQPETEPEAEPETGPAPSAFTAPDIAIHGFVSQGAFVSTDNDFIGTSSRGSLELFEAGINVSTELTDRLHAGVQIFARNVGTLSDKSPRLDWGYLDYRHEEWLGIRGGVIKMPLGLYNEYTDIDAARLPILLPQGIYPLRNRDVVLSHTGFALYGRRAFATAGELEYQVWLGSLTIPRTALELSGGDLDRVDTKYVTGAQLFWAPPVEGLRVGGSFLRASIDFHITLSPATVDALVAAMLVPADFDGKVLVAQRPTSMWVGSVEYLRGDWTFAAEYGRFLKRQVSDLPMVLPAFEEDAESFYALASYRLSSRFEVGGYYSAHHADVGDRQGREPMRYAQRHHAWQRDATATLRFDVNRHWLWKLEGHFIDGTAQVSREVAPRNERYWGLFLVKTTVTF